MKAADLTKVYHRVADALAIDLDDLNLEGACILGGRLRWFQRGNGASGIASGSVDLPLDGVLDLVSRDGIQSAPLEVVDVLRYDLGELEGVKLAVTDAAALPDGRVLVSTAAEDTGNPVDDGEILGAAIALLHGSEVQAVTELPHPTGAPWKVEGLGLRAVRDGGVDVLAVVDQDAPGKASLAASITLWW